MRYPDRDELETLHNNKLVYKRPHPDLPLWIYNYSNRAQRIKPADWPKPLVDARGLVLDHKGEIVGRGFQKFFGIQQMEYPEGLYNVYEKLDGTLILVLNFQGQRIVATRGSFASPEAQWARKWFDEFHPDFVPDPGQTFCFEGIFPEKQLVVEYQNTRECTLLAVLDEHASDLDDVFDATTRFRKVRKLAASVPRAELRTFFEDQPNCEGYVIRLMDGRQPSTRFKIKLATYRNICRALTQVDTDWMLNSLKWNKTDAIERVRNIVPASVRCWMDEKLLDFEKRYQEVVGQAQQAIEEARAAGVYENDVTFSAWVFEHHARLSPVIFEIRKNGDRHDKRAVWTRIDKPENSRPTILDQE